jgi:hypothetical protein
MPWTDRDEPSSAPCGRLPVMLLALLITLGTTVALNVVVNPYGAWPSTMLEPIFRTMNWRTARISAPYRARLERPHTLLLGNSRVLEGMPIPTGLRDGTSNIAMAGATMDELAALVALALKPGSPRHLVWGVDFSAFSAHYRGFRDAETERRLRGDAWLRARETALSFDALSASARTLVRAAGGRARLPPEERAPVPWQPEAVAAALAGLGDPTVPDLDQPTRVQITHWLEFYRHCALAPERVALFAHTVATIRAAGIELHAFLPPLSPYELEIIRQAGAWPAFLEWKRAVAGVTSGITVSYPCETVIPAGYRFRC